jgi:hypothetical protein
MEALRYILGEQVGGAAGMRSEQPDNSAIEKSVSVCCVVECVCVCVCVCVCMKTASTTT